MKIPVSATLTRQRWRIRGQVQGVGFRPFIYRIATREALTGHVLNDAQGVLLEVQGTVAALARFQCAFAAELPPLARVDDCRRETVAPLAGEDAFTIDASLSAGTAPAGAAVTIDSAVCADCLAEMRNPADRRHGHALINCTNCGPRFSIIRDVPYDRPNTTMAAFAMCPGCRQEYENPADRRFHAQPVCCPQCGPQMELVWTAGSGATAASAPTSSAGPKAVLQTAALEEAARLLLAGKIVAIKGLGGFHLAVRADSAEAVDRLRALKQRDAKPFALMVASLEHARELVTLSEEGARELASARAAIVLAPRTTEAENLVGGGVAPGTHLLGVMLPYTPLQHLLWDAMEACVGEGRSLKAAQQATLTRDLRVPALVMTSGNLSNEPLVIDNADAVVRLGPLCDAILRHDRPIERCVDDSVLLDRPASTPLPVRRSRGYAPMPWRLDHASDLTALCVGGELKNTAALFRRGEVILSQHFGDLSRALAYEHFLKGIDDLMKLFDVRPGEVRFVAHDMHPSYMSTHAARHFAERCKAQLVPIQHHVAHAAGLLAEHRVAEPAMVVVCDGTGFGIDGTTWGGELFAMNLATQNHAAGVPGAQRWRRLGRLKPMRLCGGDAAARDTRRCALALLHGAFGERFAETDAARALYPDARELKVHAQMIRTGFNSPWTSSTGRLFDGVAGLLGLCSRNDHEAQAPMALEMAAYRARETTGSGAPLFEVMRDDATGLWELDLTLLVRHLVAARQGPLGSRDTGALAALFHRVLAEGWIALASASRPGVLPATGNFLGASGGSFCNQILERHFAANARAAGFAPLFHSVYPATDAGLAFGQAAFLAGQSTTG